MAISNSYVKLPEGNFPADFLWNILKTIPGGLYKMPDES